MWNHRVMRKTTLIPSFGDEPSIEYGIHEVFYDEKDKVVHWTEAPVAVEADSIEDLRQTLRWMREALSRPILDYKTGKEIK